MNPDGVATKVGIIGAGISGLSAALELAKNGHEVEVFQREDSIGGLMATFDLDGLSIEHFYHFLCLQDYGYFELAEELGLFDRVRFHKSRTGFYFDGKLYPFTSPMDLLRFPAIPFVQRIRFGLFALEARQRTEWQQLDELTAKPWLIDRVGKRTYDIVFHPLLALKFGKFHDQISAAWVWHRLHRVAQSKSRMGYLEGGTSLLLDTLVEQLKARGVTIHMGTPVERITADGDRVKGLVCTNGHEVSFDRIISTVPLSLVAKLMPEGFDDYKAALNQVDYIGVACVVVKLRRPVSKNFWLNVNDPRVPFNGIIEYTNLNPLDNKHGHIVYVPYYVPIDHELYTMSDEDILKQSWDAVKLIQPKLTDEDLIAHHVSRAAFAQAICTTGFSKTLPSRTTPLKGLHLMDSTFLYPEDRSQAGNITLSKTVVHSIDSDGALDP